MPIVRKGHVIDGPTITGQRSSLVNSWLELPCHPTKCRPDAWQDALRGLVRFHNYTIMFAINSTVTFVPIVYAFEFIEQELA